jgi:AcrR family transcriptional regulator
MAKAVTSSRQRAVLSRERIVSAAVSLIDTEGLDAFSMRRLGNALAVEAMSLYRHFPSKGALLEAVVARLLAELPVPAPTAARWQDAFRAVARAYRALLTRHPKAIPLLATLELSNPGSLAVAGAIMALFSSAGFDPRTSLYILATGESFVIGFAYWEAGTAALREGRAAPPPVPPGADPYLVAHWNELTDQDCDKAFEFGLDVLIAGLEKVRNT